MNRTRVLALVAAVLAVALAACGTTGGTHAAERARAQPAVRPAQRPVAMPRATRPNILVIETDDMRWDELRWMPNVRRLIARTGLSFENSFAPYPLCCPSRSSFLSGKYAHNHHVFDISSPYGFRAFHDKTTIATALQHAGYRTALIGKYLNGYGQQNVRGTHRSSLHYVPPGWTRWYGSSDHLWKPGDRMQGGTYDYFSLVQNANGRLRWFPGQYSTDVLARETRGVLRRFTAQRAPWFVWWTPTAPHHGSPIEPDDPGTTYNARGEPTHWVTPARPDWVKGRFDALITHGLGTPPNHSAEADVSDKPAFLRRNPQLLPIEKQAETTVTRQRAESLYVLDRQIGRTLAALRRSGEYRRTLIVFTSDNGYYLGEHLKRQGKINLHEPSLRVPLLITGPGIAHGKRYDPATTVDLAPTFAGYAGAHLPGVDGVDLRPTIARDRGWIRPVVTEGRMPERRYRAAVGGPRFADPLNTRGLRLGRWKLIEYAPGARELYDLRRDPLELHNLATVPRYRSTLHDITRLWRRREYCKGRGCSAPLPVRWQLTPAQERSLTEHEVAATKRWFSDEGLAGRLSAQ